jgi:small-conductance mechanosensitive channel
MEDAPTLQALVAQIGSPAAVRALAPQALALALSVALAWVADRGWTRHGDARIRARAQGRYRLDPRAASKRLAFPVVLLALLMLGRSLLSSAGLPTALLELAIQLAFVFAAIRILVYLLRTAAGPGKSTERMEVSFAAALWLVAALQIIGWLPAAISLLDGAAIEVGETRISLAGVIAFTLKASLLVLLALALARAAEANLTAENELDAGVRLGLARLVRYGLVGLAVIIALSASGFDLTTLTVVGGALGVGIGFGLQKVASNLISGFLLMFDRSIRPGDVISIGESYGWVVTMSARYLVVRDPGGVDTLIPNEELITSQVKNWSYSDRHVRVKVPVQISYGDDPESALDLLLEAAAASPRVLAEPPPVAHLLSFGDNGIDLQLSVWINDPEQGINNVRSAINLAIWRSFKSQGITIPFPQRDVRITIAKDEYGRRR